MLLISVTREQAINTLIYLYMVTENTRRKNTVS